MKKILTNSKIALKDTTIEAFIRARKKSGMTQKEISEKAGIAQPDISKLESGNANPSVRTLQRLANAIGMELEIKFQPIRKKENKVENQLLQ
ncbi:MAG: helix-turn-helix transcriptional regulator [Synergistaceae bacterium]|nr:helix-turn-helix transcriptional regulator [Synergistaceae bacterium]